MGMALLLAYDEWPPLKTVLAFRMLPRMLSVSSTMGWTGATGG